MILIIAVKLMHEVNDSLDVAMDDIDSSADNYTTTGNTENASIENTSNCNCART